MSTENIAWELIQQQLVANEGEQLAALLRDAKSEFNGDYELQVPAENFSALCAYYPQLEARVQNLSACHLRLSTDRPLPMGSKDLSLDLSASQISDVLLNPEAIVAVPAYLLRFTPYYGSTAVLIATALRQAFYRSSRENGSEQLYPHEGDQVKIAVDGLLDILGNSISRAKFFRCFQNGSLDWFVRRAPARHQLKDGRIQRQANTYLYMGSLLTPGDARDLSRYLLGRGLLEDPVRVLSEACSTPRNQILCFPFTVPDSRDCENLEAMSVHQVLSHALAPTKLDAQLSALCDRLSAHLIRPQSFLSLPWYWFRKVLPEIGDDFGLLYLMSKSCCYVDWAHGRDRNRFWVPGGLSTLQAWVRSSTAPLSIPHANESKRGRPRSKTANAASEYTRSWRESGRELLGQYLQRVGTRSGEIGTDWQLEVADVHLTRSDEILKDSLFSFLYSAPASGLIACLKRFSTDEAFQNLLLKDSREHPLRLCHFETLVSEGHCHFETLDREAICHFDTLIKALNSYFETLIGAEICYFDTIIKILLKIRHAFFFEEILSTSEIPEISPDTNEFLGSNGENRALLGFFDGIQWNYELLLGRINPLLKQQILTNRLQEAFLSWCIHGSLQLSVHNPLSLAVSRTLQNRVDAGGAALRLAKMPAMQVAEMLWSYLQRVEEGHLGPIFSTDQALGELQSLLNESPAGDHARLLRRLADLLGLRAA